MSQASKVMKINEFRKKNDLFPYWLKFNRMD